MLQFFKRNIWSVQSGASLVMEGLSDLNPAPITGQSDSSTSNKNTNSSEKNGNQPYDVHTQYDNTWIIASITNNIEMTPFEKPNIHQILI